MVTRNRLPASSIRVASALAENPPNTTLCGAPIRAQASMAIGSSGTIGMCMVTMSPSSTPNARRPAANSFTRLYSSR